MVPINNVGSAKRLLFSRTVTKLLKLQTAMNVRAKNSIDGTKSDNSFINAFVIVKVCIKEN